MISVVQSKLQNICKSEKKNKRSPTLQGTTNTKPKFKVHKLGSNDNHFLEAVVNSVIISAGINLQVETYSGL